MNTTHKIIGSAVAVLAAGSVLIATPTAVGAQHPQRWDICPAADTVPLCEIVRSPSTSSADGPEVAHLPAADGISLASRPADGGSASGVNLTHMTPSPR